MNDHSPDSVNRGVPRIIPRSDHPVSRSAISANALRVLYRLKEAGFQGFLVGGCVRDIILGRHPKDFDVATDALPEEVRRLFRNCRLVGRRFRLAHVVFGREVIEVATFRAASAPPPNEEPMPAREEDEEELLEEELEDELAAGADVEAEVDDRAVGDHDQDQDRPADHERGLADEGLDRGDHRDREHGRDRQPEHGGEGATRGQAEVDLGAGWNDDPGQGPRDQDHALDHAERERCDRGDHAGQQQRVAGAAVEVEGVLRAIAAERAADDDRDHRRGVDREHQHRAADPLPRGVLAIAAGIPALSVGIITAHVITGALILALATVFAVWSTRWIVRGSW